MSTDHHAGLEDVKALESAITHIEGSSLRFRGISIEELAEKASFEEVLYLLWYGRLPGKAELEKLSRDLRENNELPLEIQEQINHIPRQAHPMAALRSLVSSLALYDHEADDLSQPANYRKAIRIQAKIPFLVTAFERHRKAKAGIKPVADLGYAANFLYTLWGEKPDQTSAAILNTALILYAEHELNASTFTARVTTATLSDMHSGITAALASLKGSLHGGANQKAMEMILDIGTKESVKEYIDEKLSAREKIMGFGHRVYKSGDPRVPILRKMCQKLCEERGFVNYYEVAITAEEYMKEKKNLLPNVDFYSGLVFYALGFPNDMFTPVFAVSRTAGWIAHILEQYANNRLIRPRAVYTGPEKVTFTELENR